MTQRELHKVLFSADYRDTEARLVAHYMGDVMFKQERREIGMFSQRYNDKFASHRIVQTDEAGNVLHEGEEVGYRSIASLNAGGKSAIVVTEYHLGGPLVPGQIYFVEAQ